MEDRKVLPKQRSLLQFIMFAGIGVLNTAVDVAVYWLLLQLSVPYLLANIAAYSAGMLNSYIWNSAVTFRSAIRRPHAVRVRFVIWNLLTLLISSLLILLMVESFGWSELCSKVITTILIVVLQFLGTKKWVFRQ